MKTITTSAIFSASALTLQVQAQDALKKLETTTLTGNHQDLVSDISIAKQKIAQNPGASSVLTSENWTGGFVQYEDIFQFEPGVYARNSVSHHDSRISVRGSGIQRRFGTRGLSLLINGIPANHSDGTYRFRLIDPQSIDHIETFRGGNGLAYGGSQLGGAINVIQKTGLSNPGSSVILEYGSFESYKASFQHGGSQGNWDWFLGYSYTDSDGYRPHADTLSHHVTANVGYRWSDEAQTRFHFMFNDTDALLTGTLTKDQFQEDPRTQINTLGNDHDISGLRFGKETVLETAKGRWSLSANYQYLDFDHLTTPAGSIFPGFPSIDNLIDFDSDELALNVRGHEDYNLFGLKHTFRTSVGYTFGVNEIGGSSGFGAVGIVDRKETSSNLNLYFENQTYLDKKNSFIYGIGYNNSFREREILSGDTTGVDGFRDTQDGFTYRVGYLHEASEATQFYANISRSFESAPFSEASSSTIAAPQFATTFEVGSRFEYKWISGELTTYLSDVKDEFVFEETAFRSNIFDVTNADTTRFGIEAAAHLDLNEALGLTFQPQFSLDVSYQYNDFTFDEGPAEGNQIPAISEHIISSKLTLAGQDQRWSTSISVDWLPSGLVADNNNTLTVPGYAIFDLYGEYKFSDSVSLYGGITNLFDKDHVATTFVNPAGEDAAFINPGSGRAGYVGVKYNF